MNRYISIAILLSLVSSAIAQIDIPKTKKTLKADAVYETNELLKALELYKDAYTKAETKEEKAYIMFQRGQIQRMTLEYKKAAARYKSAIQKDYPDPIVHFYYASMLQATMNYEEALSEFQLYDKLVPNDSLAALGIKSCRASVEWVKSPTRYQIDNLKDLNSRESDFAATFGNALGTEVVFTSGRKRDGLSKISKVTGQYYTSIFEIYQNRAGEWEEVKALNDTINSKFDDGSPSFSSDYNTMYFTRCKTVKDVYLGCQIYKGERQPGEYFQSAEFVPVVADSLSIGQPSISKDGLTLYFASDMPGGFGGRDIWKVERDGPSAPFGKPINMGPTINTVGNELYPYIRDNGVLYFASDYHPGMGGMDIFRAIPKGDDWVIYNMKYPINSSADDFAISYKQGKEEGLFTSSRKLTEITQADGSILEIKSRGLDDIYSFILPIMEFSLTGIISDVVSSDFIQDAVVEIYGDDGSEMTIQTGEEGRFKYTLKKDVDYIYIVKKEGYLNGRGAVSTMDLDDSKHFKQQTQLAKIGEPIALDNIFYDFGKWTLTDSSKIELQKLVKILNDNPNITIELASHTDMIGDDASNIILSQKRAQSVVDFLIENGIAADRLTAKGYGETKPQTISDIMAKKLPFSSGVVLTAEFIEQLKTDDSEDALKKVDLANQINRRTEFSVVSTRYIPDIDE
ncbi:MAG: OmpA family protein [Bacteroidales bacterium]|nr:OmpA family protein [Bacteroidales bacterium]